MDGKNETNRRIIITGIVIVLLILLGSANVVITQLPSKSIEYTPQFVDSVVEHWETGTPEWQNEMRQIIIDNGMAYMDETIAIYLGVWDGYAEED